MFVAALGHNTNTLAKNPRPNRVMGVESKNITPCQSPDARSIVEEPPEMGVFQITPLHSSQTL